MLKGRAMGEYNTLKLLWQENRPDPIRTMLTIQMMAKGLGQDPGGLSRGLRKLAEVMKRDQGLRKTVQILCEALRKGRRFKKSTSHA